MMTLYGTAGSGSAAVELALRRCDAPWRMVRASSWEADSTQAELRALTPLAQIPTLQLDDGTALSGSAAILMRFGLNFPVAGLLPVKAQRPAVHAQLTAVEAHADCVQVFARHGPT